MLDACAVDGLGMLPTSLGMADPSVFFVGDIDATEAEKPNLRTCQSSNDLMMTVGMNTEGDLLLAQDQSELILGTSAPANLQPSGWGTFPSIPEHAELQMQAPAFGQPSGMDGSDSYPLGPTAGSSPSTSSTSSAHEDPAARGGVPRVVSMPNLTFVAGQGGYSGTDLRRRAAANRSGGIPRSRSANDVSDLSKYIEVPHSEFLTPPHLRKGKGGRQPAADPRLDPRIDPKKARRILANRLSAAKSKMKQKGAVDAMRQRVEMLRLQKETLSSEVGALSNACAAEEAQRAELLRQLRATEERLMCIGGLGSAPGKAPMAHFASTAGRVGLVG